MCEDVIREPWYYLHTPTHDAKDQDGHGMETITELAKNKIIAVRSTYFFVWEMQKWFKERLDSTALDTKYALVQT